MTSYIFNIYSLIYSISVFIALLVIALVLRRWQLLAVKYIIFFELATAIWSFASIFEVAATTVHLKQLWSQISYLGITTSPVLCVLFALSYAKQKQFLTLKFHILVFIIPLLTLIVTATNPLHGWLWPSIVINPETNMATYYQGPWFWINVIYCYLTLFSGILILFYTVMNIPGHYKSQIIALITAASLPLVGNVMYVFRLNPLPGLDITPIALMFTGLILSYAVLKFKVFDLVPIARHTLLDNMNDGLLVTDMNDRVIDINKAMKDIINTSFKKIIGKKLKDILSNVPELLEIIRNKELHQKEFLRDGNCYDIGITPIHQEADHFGKLIVLRDITERKKIEQEREQLLVELQSVLQEVKELSGLLPICANCKKIRDDGGYWHEVESYVMNHTKAQFSHGICPECRSKLYPEFPREKGASKDAPQNQ